MLPTDHAPVQQDEGAAETEALASSLRLAVTRMARRLRRQGEARISPTMLSALSTVEQHGPLTLGRLAEHEGVQPPTVTATVGRLEEAGLVARRIDPDDRRVANVDVTPAGRRLLARSRSRKTAYLARRIERLGAADRAALARAVAIIEDMLEAGR